MIVGKSSHRSLCARNSYEGGVALSGIAPDCTEELRQEAEAQQQILAMAANLPCLYS